MTTGRGVGAGVETDPALAAQPQAVLCGQGL